jgi:V/A-type H+-transporting ATPase subunit I
MLVRMVQVDVVGPRRSTDALVRSMHRAGLLHIVPFEAPEGVSPAVFLAGEPDGRADRLRRTRTRIGELDEALRPGNGQPSPEQLEGLWSLDEPALEARVDGLDSVRSRAESLTSERVRLAGEIARLESYRRLIEGLRSVVHRLPAVRGYGSTGIVVGTRYRAVIPMIQEELEGLTRGRCAVVAADLDGDRVAAVLLYPVRHAAEVQSLLGGRDLEEVTLPEDYSNVPFDRLGPRLASEQARLAARAASITEELDALGREHGATVHGLRLVLDDRISETEVLSQAGISDHLVVFSGWVPTDALAGLRDRLRADVGGEVLVIERPKSRRPAADAPVALSNLPVIRAFEPLVGFMATPRYGTIDPTPLFALTLPAFIGLMVGDVGYGLVLLALLLLVRWRWGSRPLVTALWPIGMVAAIATIAFGVLYGEWFGEAGAQLLGIAPIWMDRGEAIEELLVLAIAIGVLQVGLGMVLGVVNSALLHHRREMFARSALLASLLGGLIVVAWLAGPVPEMAGYAAIAVIVVALFVLVATLGIYGPLEVIGAFGNVLSYARLMAIGLASVMLAMVANRLGGLFDNLLVAVLVAGALHALNIGLGFFDSSIQGLRLHYVEFLGKFAEPGGTRYEPFASIVASRSPAAGPVGGG